MYSRESGEGQGRIKKRRRTVISCTECHRRKQKCDRQFPCCNCVKRGSQESCSYHHEQGGNRQSTGARPFDRAPSVSSNSINTVLPISQFGPVATDASNGPGKFSDFGYSRQSSHNSLALIRATEQRSDYEHTLTYSFGNSRNPSPGIRKTYSDKRYIEMARHLLPPRPCIDLLIQTFFYAVNWQYDSIDEEHFRRQLNAWDEVSYSALQAGPDNLSPEIRVFPALLFEVLAQALLFHPAQDERLTNLNVMTGMTFFDLGVEFSDAGAEILVLLGKNDITLGTVQAGLLRASFLKSSGKVIEAWHILGATIRDAQEIGLHVGQFTFDQSSTLLRGSTTDTEERYTGHKIWITLHIWDTHMAVVLGRPIATSLVIDDYMCTIKNDAARHDLFLHWQNDTTPPRPFDVILAGYNVAYKYFPQICHLGQSGARPQDYVALQNLHATLKDNLMLLPSWCRLKDPDTTFDQKPGFHWLPLAREGFYSLVHLVFLTLHRPFIFTRINSRTEALNAGISILRAQERLFERMEPQSYKIFNPVYASFDALVLVAAVCLAFCDQCLEQLPECIQVMENGTKRLETIGQLNPMARSAHAVVWNLYSRVQHRRATFGTTWSSRSELIDTTLTSTSGDADNLTGVASGLSFDNILPPHPTHDLFDDNLSLAHTLGSGLTNNLPFNPSIVDLADGWVFDGRFTDASFWSWVNGANF